VRQLGIAATIFGVALSLFGWRPMRYLWFPLAYLVIFGTTYTDRILQIVTERLQDISALGGYFLLLVLGNDVDLAGNSITIHPAGTEADGVTPLSPIPLNVAEACSGMRMLVAFMALGTLMAYIGLKQWWQRILLMILAVPVAVFVNVLRVATLGVLSLWDRGFSDGQFHTFVGFVWLVPAFLVFLGLMEIVRRLVVDAPSESRNGPSEKSAT
jgi:exosortase